MIKPLYALVAALVFVAPYPAPAQSPATGSQTPNLCMTFATDISSRWVVQLLSGTPTRTDQAPDPLVGRFASAVNLYSLLGCPIAPLAGMLECLSVADNDTGGDPRAMLQRRQLCEDTYRVALFSS